MKANFNLIRNVVRHRSNAYFYVLIIVHTFIMLYKSYDNSSIPISYLTLILVPLLFLIPSLYITYKYVVQDWNTKKWTDILILSATTYYMWCGYLSGIIAEMTVVTTMCIVAGVSTVMGYLTMKHIVSLWAAYCTFYITTLFLESDDVRLLKLIIPFFLFMCLYGMLLMSDVLKKQIITNKRLLATARRDSSVIRQRTREVEEEKQKSEDLLLNILPAETAEELKQSGVAKAKTYSMVTVMFTDFKGFTKVSEKVSAELLVAEIDCCFSAFDEITQRYGLEKIKTVGDAYICAGGLPVPNYTHAADMVNAALEICDFIETRRKEKESRGEPPFEIRIGIHTGPVVAGIVGKRKFAYDIWGDTVNTAARMEQNSEAGKINISETTYELIKGKFPCNFRGEIDAKNKGKLKMYFVEGVV